METGLIISPHGAFMLHFDITLSNIGVGGVSSFQAIIISASVPFSSVAHYYYSVHWFMLRKVLCSSSLPRCSD